MWIYILIFVVVVIAAYLAVYVYADRIIEGGRCDTDTPSKQRTVRRPRGSQIGKTSSRLPPKNTRLVEFRTRASPCTIDNPKGLCRELVDFYVDWRNRLIEESPDNAGRILIVRHSAEWCPYCIAGKAAWSSVLNEYTNGEDNSRYIFIENNEDQKRTPGIRSIPTIVKFDGVRICVTSTRDYDKLLDFVRNG